MKTTLVMCLLLLGCGEIIPCKTDDLGTREVHTGTLRMDGVYVADKGGLNCSENSINGSGNITLLYSSGLCFIAGCASDSERGKLSSTIPEISISRPARPGLGIFWQRGTELLIHSWEATTRPCNKMVTQKGTIVNDSTFQIYFWSLEGKDHDVSWTFKLYPGITKPDSTNNFIP